jgi:hypothetical protein
VAALAADLGVVRTQSGFAMTTATALLLLGVAGAGSPIGDMAIAVSLAIPSREGTPRVSVGSPARHFHVIIRNIGETPQRIWDETFSWGYEALSFEVVGDDGSVSVIRKKEAVFTRNVPAYWIVDSGGSFVFDVYLGNRKTWDGVPSPGPSCKAARLRAVYAVSPDDESKKLGVWTGRVSSTTERIELCQ